MIEKGYKEYFIALFIIGIIAMPVMDAIITQRDRNRNLVYGKLFWKYGFNVYNLNDYYIRENFNVSDDSLMNTERLNITYEYPPAVLLFFANISLIPAPQYFQRLLVNFVLLIIIHINLYLVLKIGGTYKKKKWFWLFLSAIYISDWILGICGGKMEPLTNLFVLLCIYFFKKKEWAKSAIFLAIAVQIKIYPLLLVPYFIYKVRKQIKWFFLAIMPSAIIWLWKNSVGATLMKHVLNETTYSPFYTNPLFLGRIYTNPLSILPFIIFVFSFFKIIKSLRNKECLLLLVPLFGFFVFGWVMPWYLVWPLPMALILENERDMKKFLSNLGFLGMMYLIGFLINLNYFVSNKLTEEFMSHFNGSVVMKGINETLRNITPIFHT